MSSDEEPKTGSGKPGPGRPLGALNKISRDLKDAMLAAAVLSPHAKDAEHPELAGTLNQYMLTMEQEFPELFFQAVVKLIPKEVKQFVQHDTQIDVTYSTVTEVKNAMLESGMTHQQIAMIESMLPVPLDEDATS